MRHVDDRTTVAVADLLPARLQAPTRQLSAVFATSLWVMPTTAGVLAIVAAVLALGVPNEALPLELPISEADAGRAALTTVLSATIAATSLVFTGTVVAIQLATGQYSPRLLRNVLLDPRIRTALAVFVGTVVYTLAVIPQIGASEAPSFAVTIGLVLGLAVVASLVAFLDRIVQRLRLETIIGDVRDDAIAAVERVHPTDAQVDEVELDEDADAVAALRSGFIQSVSMAALVDAAEQHGVALQMAPRVGDFLVTGTDAAYAWRSDGGSLDADVVDELAHAVDGALALGVDRSISDDPAYGLRHLVDIGLRGVSPGINDPTTAQQTIHLATEVLVALAQRHCMDSITRRDEHVVVVRRPDFASYLELAQSQLLQYGGHDPRVVEALVHQLRDVVSGGTNRARVAAVRTHLALIRDDAQQRDHSELGHEIITAACSTVEDLLDGVAATDEEQAAG